MNPTYDVVFSYQGAFGPPTFGHFKSMEMFAKKILHKYQNEPSKKILMLFMPTALSGSKIHLEQTQENRINVLHIFCEFLTLRYSIKTPIIKFEASKIEYELCKEPILNGDGTSTPNKDTGTYRTIDKLKNLYPTSTIILGMGKDNILQLPYWKNIDEYHDKVKSIYVVNRELSEAEKETVADFIIKGQSLPFQKILPWPKPKEDIHNIFGITGIIDNYEKGTDVTKIQNNYVNQIVIPLPEIVVLSGLPPATSSSMLRYYIYKYIIEHSEGQKIIIKDKITKIMFGTMYGYGEDVDNTINAYKNENNEYKFSVPIDDGYDEKYSIIKNDEFKVGGKSTENNRKKSNKRNNLTRKNRTRKNQKSKNKKPPKILFRKKPKSI
jgi:nicotinic acid mononucleotide adenylyltransferase